MTLNPRKTPHSMMDPLTGSAILKISYIARNRFNCWRLTYLGKFSNLVSILSEELIKTFSIALPTDCSVSVLKVFIIFLLVIPPSGLHHRAHGIGSCLYAEILELEETFARNYLQLE